MIKIEDYISFADKIVASTVKGLYAHREDIRQEAYLGLIKASETFKSELGVPFKGYANRIIKNYIYGYIRQIDKVNGNEYLYLDSPDKFGNDNIGNVESDQHSFLFDDSEDYTTVLNTFSERDKNIIQLRIDGWTEMEVAERFNISQPRVNTIFNNFKNKIKEVINYEN